jgi:hypothetical protein
LRPNPKRELSETLGKNRDSKIAPEEARALGGNQASSERRLWLAKKIVDLADTHDTAEALSSAAIFTAVNEALANDVAWVRQAKKRSTF